MVAREIEPQKVLLPALGKIRGNIRNYLEQFSGTERKAITKTSLIDGVELFADFYVASQLSGRDVPGEKYLEIKKKIESSLAEELQKKTLKKENFAIRNGKIELTIHSDMRNRLETRDFNSPILMKAAKIDERLIRYQYAVALTNEINFLTREKGFIGFEWKYERLISMAKAEEPLSESGLIALTFLEQVAKVLTQSSINKELKGLRPYNDSTSVSLVGGIDKLPEFINKKFKSTFDHLEYLDIIEMKLWELAQAAGISTKEMQLLGDLCFFHSEGLGSGEWTKLISPIIKAVKEKRYQGAYNCRDFLLNQFLSGFPTWRKEEYLKLNPDARSHKNFTDLIMEKDSQSLSLDDFPSEYSSLIADSRQQLEQLEQEQEKLKSEHNEKIRKEKILSNILLQTIAIVANKQKNQEIPLPFNSEVFFEKHSSLILHSELGTKIGGTTRTLYIEGVMENKNGVFTHLLVSGKHQNYYRSIESIFAHLLPQEDVSKKILDEAFEYVKQSDYVEVEKSDDLREIMREFLPKLKKHIVESREGNSYVEQVAEGTEIWVKATQRLIDSL